MKSWIFNQVGKQTFHAFFRHEDLKPSGAWVQENEGKSRSVDSGGCSNRAGTENELELLQGKPALHMAFSERNVYK